MSDFEGMKLVDFELYCPKCMHRDKDDWDYPCNKCIPNGARRNSTVPYEYDGPKLVTPAPSMKEKLGLE